MTRDEFEFGLEFYGFKKQKFSEYHNNVFTNTTYEFGEKSLNLEIYADTYSVRIVWLYSEGKKVAKCYYINKEVALYNDAKMMIDDFVSSMKQKYAIEI